MNSHAGVMVLVEGPTEQRFIKDILAPSMAVNGVFLTAAILDKPGQKGGDVKFTRAQNDIGKHLKQRADTFVTLMVDYYGIKSDWPGYAASKKEASHNRKAEVLNEATARAVVECHPDHRPDRRFIPYVSMHEIEALYFSAPEVLAEKHGVARKEIDAILVECGEPERINDDSRTAPSKRLIALTGRFQKTSTGLAIAREIGIPRIREKCSLFDTWLRKLESLVSTLGPVSSSS